MPSTGHIHHLHLAEIHQREGLPSHLDFVESVQVVSRWFEYNSNFKQIHLIEFVVFYSFIWVSGQDIDDLNIYFSKSLLVWLNVNDAPHLKQNMV